MALVLLASGASAAVLVSDSFTYPDGALVGNGAWASHSGSVPTDFEVLGGQALIQNNAVDPYKSADVNIAFAPDAGLGEIYASFDLSVDGVSAPIDGTDFEYFAHFMDSGYGYRSRLDIVAPNGAGDFSIGLSTSESTADLTWGTDLTFDTVYHVVISYNQITNVSKMWIDPVGVSATYIEAPVGDPAVVIEKFGFRQANSSPDELIYIDNLIVANACEDVFQACPTVSAETASFGQLKSMFR